MTTADETFAAPRERSAARGSAWGERVVLWGLVGLVLVAPLPAGAYRPWAWSALALVAGLLLIGWAAQALARGAVPLEALRAIRWPAALYLGALAWGFLQWLPWTPGALHHPIWAEAAAVLGSDPGGRIAVNPGEALTGLMRLASYGALFVLAFVLALRTSRASVLLGAVALSAVVYALYGLLNHPMLGGQLGLDFDPERAARWNFSGPFGNRNNYATFLGIGLVCLLALILREAHAALTAPGGWGRRLALLLERLLGRRFYLLLAVVPVTLALVLTASRAGIAATALGIAVLLAAAVRARYLAVSAAAGVAALCLVAGAVALSYGGERLVERAGGITEQIRGDGGPSALFGGTRAALNDLTLRASVDNPLGTGLGSYGDVFAHYRDGRLTSDRHFDLAHNSYAENLLELGWLGAGALFLAVAAAGLMCWQGLARRRRSLAFPMIGVAVTVLVAFHAIFDFSLQIPAVAAAFAVLMGACCGQSLATDERR